MAGRPQLTCRLVRAEDTYVGVERVTIPRGISGALSSPIPERRRRSASPSFVPRPQTALREPVARMRQQQQAADNKEYLSRLMGFATPMP
ncbi:hypothetical protein RB213_001176 [Colletotrichum asianum]